MIQLFKQSKLKQIIPDKDHKGLTDELHFTQSGKIEDITVMVNIKHTHSGDLTVVLHGPDGQKRTLHDRSGGRSDNLQLNIGSDLLQDFIGAQAKGVWKLHVRDMATRDEGTLESWSVDLRCSKNAAKSEIIIPDNNAEGLSSVQVCKHSGRITKLEVMVDVEHSHIGDIKVSLISPAKTEVVLHDRSGGTQNNLKKHYSGEMLKPFIGENTKGKWTLKMLDFARRDEGNLKHWKLLFNFQDIDDLKKVEGIGPKIEGLLNQAGIWSFSRLSVTAKSDLQSILAAAGERYKMHDPSTWAEQAAMADRGEWDELKQLQDELQGGKVRS